MSARCLFMLKRYMHKRERHFAMLNDNRVVRPFEWGTEFINEHANGDDPRELFAEYSRQTIANSDEFFFKPDIRDYKLNDGAKGEPQTVTWTSGILTPSPENNTAYAAYFPHETNRK